MDGSPRFPLERGNRTRQTFDTPPSSYRPRVSLDGAQSSQGGSSRYGTPSPSLAQGQDDFRARLNRLSLQSSDSASPLSRSSSMRSRPGGGVADVGLGRRSTMLDRGSLRGGLDFGSREAVQPRQDSPYRPSTSQSRYDERGVLSESRNGRDHLATDRNRLRASPGSSYSYRSSRHSNSGGPSPSRTPTPTAAIGLDDHIPTSSRWSQPRGSELDSGSRISGPRPLGRNDGSSAARSVSNSTVRNYEENEDETINFRREKDRQMRRLEEERVSRDASPQLDHRIDMRSERSFTPVSSRSQARGEERIIRPAEDHDMLAEEKVDMWMRSGSTRDGSGDDPAAKRRGALPFEFRNDMATPTRPTAGGRQQTITAPTYRESASRSSTGIDLSPAHAQRYATGPAPSYSGLRTSTSPTSSMVTGRGRFNGTTMNGESSGTPGRNPPTSMISSGSVAGDSDLAESRRRRKALLQSASQHTPLITGSHTPIRSSTLDVSRGFDGRVRYTTGQIASEPRATSRIGHIRPSTSMSHLWDIQEPWRSMDDVRSYRQSMVYLPSRAGDVGVEGLPDSPLARYHHRQTNSSGMSPQTDGPFVTTRSSVINSANGIPRAPSPARSIMSTANSTRPSTRGTPSRVAMTRLQAKLRRTSDEKSKAMLEACVRLLTAFGMQERERIAGAQVDWAGLSRNAQLVAANADETHQRTESMLTKVNGLIEQCLEVDPDEDQGDDGEAAIVLVNVQAGLEEVKASLQQVDVGGKELIALLTSMFDALQGYQVVGQNSANSSHLENVEEAEGVTAEEETRTRGVKKDEEAGNLPAFKTFGIFTNEPSTEEPVTAVADDHSHQTEDTVAENKHLGSESTDDNHEIEPEMVEEAVNTEPVERADEVQTINPAMPETTSEKTDEPNDVDPTPEQEDLEQAVVAVHESSESSPASPSNDASTEFPITPTVATPVSLSQNTVPRQAVRSRKSSSTASVLSLRSRPGGNPMFSPSTPTTAVSAIVAQSAGKTRDGGDSAGGHATPSSPLAAQNRDLGPQEDYFAAQNRRRSISSPPETPSGRGTDVGDEEEEGEKEDSAAARPRYGTASQSLREIHQAR